MKKIYDKEELNNNIKNNNYVIITNENNQISDIEKENKDKS